MPSLLIGPQHLCREKATEPRLQALQGPPRGRPRGAGRAPSSDLLPPPSPHTPGSLWTLRNLPATLTTAQPSPASPGTARVTGEGTGGSQQGP